MKELLNELLKEDKAFIHIPYGMVYLIFISLLSSHG